jgi:hypothetical protein
LPGLQGTFDKYVLFLICDDVELRASVLSLYLNRKFCLIFTISGVHLSLAHYTELTDRLMIKCVYMRKNEYNEEFQNDPFKYIDKIFDMALKLSDMKQ